MTKSNVKKPRKKVLTLDKVLSQAEQIDKWSEYVVDEKENYVIKYNKIFSETKIDSLLTELYQHILSESEIPNEDKKLLTYADIVQYINFLIIKYFTNFGESMGDSLDENIKVLTFLKKHKLFLELQEFMFDPDQVSRVFEKFNTITQNAEKVTHMEKEELEALIDDIQTPFYKDKLVEQYKDKLN